MHATVRDSEGLRSHYTGYLNNTVGLIRSHSFASGPLCDLLARPLKLVLGWMPVPHLQ